MNQRSEREKKKTATKASMANVLGQERVSQGKKFSDLVMLCVRVATCITSPVFPPGGTTQPRFGRNTIWRSGDVCVCRQKQQNRQVLVHNASQGQELNQS